MYIKNIQSWTCHGIFNKTEKIETHIKHISQLS